MAIRAYLTLNEANALETAVRRHDTRLRYVVREAVWEWVFDPTTGRGRLHPPEREPGIPHREISALIPNWFYGALKWKSIGAGFHMREAFREALLRWLVLDAEGKASAPTNEGNSAWMSRRFAELRREGGEERYKLAMREIMQGQERNIADR